MAEAYDERVVGGGMMDESCLLGEKRMKVPTGSCMGVLGSLGNTTKF